VKEVSWKTYRRRWEYNIKMDLQELGWRSSDWIGLAQEQMASSCKCGKDPLGSIKCGKYLDYVRNC
jgi:hypothetical protein